MFASLGADWKIAVDFWRFSECFWKVRWVSGVLEREIAVGWIFYQKRG